MRLLMLFAIWGLLAPPALAQTMSTTPPITLAELEQLALQNNPTAAAAVAGIDAARGRTQQARAWPNPVFGYSGEEIKTGDLDTRQYGLGIECASSKIGVEAAGYRQHAIERGPRCSGDRL